MEPPYTGRTNHDLAGRHHPFVVQSIPEALRAFCLIVSLTAARTVEALVKSVPCAKLSALEFTMGWRRAERNTLRIDAQSRTVGIHEFKHYVVFRLVGVRSTSIVRKVLL